MFLLFVSSCSAYDGNENMDNAVDGLSFDFFKEYVVENTTYEISLPNNFKDAFYYEHEVGNVKSNSMEWKVNFVYDVNYHVQENKETKDVWNTLYQSLVDSKNILEEKCGFDIQLFDPYSSVELEYSLYNTGYFPVDSDLPSGTNPDNDRLNQQGYKANCGTDHTDSEGIPFRQQAHAHAQSKQQASDGTDDQIYKRRLFHDRYSP